MALRDTGSGGTFTYRKRDPKVTRAHSEQKGGMYDSITLAKFPRFVPKGGENKIRILPPTFDFKKLGVDDHWGLTIFIHRNVGADDATYLCINKMKGEDCPICARYAELRAAGEEDAADQLKISTNLAVWIIDRAEPEAGPKIWLQSWTIDRDITLLCKDEDSGEVIDPVDPDEGYDIIFTRTGEKLRTKYAGWKLSRKATAILDNPKKQKETLAFITENPLDSVLQYYDAEYTEKVLKGSKSSKREDPDDDDKPTEKPVARRRPTGGKREPEPDDNKGDEKPSPDDVSEMDTDDLKDVIKKFKLDVDPDDHPRLKALRSAVLEALEKAEPGEAEPDAGEGDEKPPTADEVGDMGADELKAVIKKFKLDVDLDEHKKLSAKQDAVTEALEAGSGEAEVDELPTAEEVDELDADGLTELCEKHGLDVDVSKLKRLSEKREAINEALDELRGKDEVAEVTEEGDEKPTVEDIDDMGASDLAEVVKKHKLKIDLDEYKRLSQKQDAVKEAFGYTDEPEEDTEKKPKDTKDQATATRNRLASLKKRQAGK